MNKSTWLITNFLVFLLLLITATSMQTSLFHWIFGWSPTIQIGVVILAYISLYRSPIEAFIFTVIGCYCIALESIMLASFNIFVGICIFLILQAVRTRVYSQSPVYFTWAALAAVLSFHLIAWLASVPLDLHTPAPKPLDWILEVLITSLFTRILFHVFQWLDKKTKRLSLTELNS